MLSLASQYGANTLATTLAVEKALNDLEPALKKQGITLYKSLHRPANFIERALQDLKESLIIAAVLILAVLYLFLRDFRAALIAFTAIPLSLLAAVAVLRQMGLTLNTMTLGGFAVALGVLVDDAIIGIENILRRLRENGQLATPKARLDIVREASLEVRGPVIYATAVVIAVFLPELFTSSVQGHFVGPLALAFIFAVVASLIVAMTATPALCALLLRRHDARPQARWLTRLKAWQSSAVHGVGAHIKATVILLVILVIAAAAALPFLGGTFMPDFREGHFVMQVSSSITGTSLDEMLKLGERISKEVLALPYVQSIEQQIGRAELGEDTWGPHRSEFHVELKPDATVDQSVAQEELRHILEHYPIRRRLGCSRQKCRQSGCGSRQGQGHRGPAIQASKRHSRHLDSPHSSGPRCHRTQGPGRARHHRDCLCGHKGRPDFSGYAYRGRGCLAARSTPASAHAAGEIDDCNTAWTRAPVSGRQC
jgi:Cu/Ag efflux pump CusA